MCSGTLAATAASGSESKPDAKAPSAAQSPAAALAAEPAAPAARPEEVATPEAIVAALYDVISGPKGQARDWNRFRSLFEPGSRMIPAGKRGTVHWVERVPPNVPHDLLISDKNSGEEGKGL